jgi:hypothetical protein
MSSSWNKPVRIHPCLPPELWLRIFDCATRIPGVLSPEIYATSDVPQRIITRRQQRLLKDSLVTKRYLVRVCKQWYILATPFGALPFLRISFDVFFLRALYETIIIGRGRTLSSLCSTLIDSKRKIDHSSNDHHLGWYTKRLDLAMRDQGRQGAASELDFLAEAIQCLPNLTIVMFSVRAPRYVEHPLPTSIMRALADTCGPTLRIVDFSECVLHPFRHDWRMLLAATSHLRVLRGPEVTPIFSEHPRPLPVLSELTALTLTSSNIKEYLTEENHFPSLHELEFHYYLPPPLDNWAGPLGVFGHNLTTVRLDFNISAGYLQGELDVLSQHCPSLIRLTLSLKLWEQLIDRLSLPSVSYLALRCWQYQAPSSGYRRLFSNLSTMYGPTLQRVCLCDYHNVADLRLRHARVLAQGLEQISHSPFQLEDHEGQPFT